MSKVNAIHLSSQTISVIVTTYATDTLYTQACLESIRRWKRSHHELIVVVHDETPLLRAYLEACAATGLIDKLLYAEANHGHTRSFNLAVRYATADVVFNVCNDILIGPSLVDDCAHKLRTNPKLGLIGWHWYNEGTFWRADGTLRDFRLRETDRPNLSWDDEQNIRNAPWFTGRTFQALNGPKWLCLCNTGFFGLRREVLERIGGGFAPTYQHYWADDFLNYAVLDQGYDISHFEAKFRQPPYFREYQYDNTDVTDRRRHADEVRLSGPWIDSIRLLGGGMTEGESTYLHLLAQALPDGCSVTNVGTWRGSSAIVLLDALKDRRAKFTFIDCFDLPGISSMSAQPPVGRREFCKYVEPYVQSHHDVQILQANTLDLDHFPASDLIFVDAGHTAECVAHDACLAKKCLGETGMVVFHDYGCPDWPDVRTEVDRVFGPLSAYQTMGTFRCAAPDRKAFRWPEP